MLNSRISATCGAALLLSAGGAEHAVAQSDYLGNDAATCAIHSLAADDYQGGIQPSLQKQAKFYGEIANRLGLSAAELEARIDAERRPMQEMYYRYFGQNDLTVEDELLSEIEMCNSIFTDAPEFAGLR